MSFWSRIFSKGCILVAYLISTVHTKGDFEDAIKTATKGFNYYLKLPFLMHNLLLCRVFTFYPLAFGRYIYNWTCKNVDLILSNVNVGINPIYLCDKKIIKIYGYLAPFCSISLNFTYMSYCGDVYAQITSDKYLQMDARQLMNIFEELLDEQINKE